MGVDLDRLSADSERINITLPKWLISAIDAKEPNRSRFLPESAIAGLQVQIGLKEATMVTNKRDPEVKKRFLKNEGYARTPIGYEVDHKIPLEDGGRDSVANMQLLRKAAHEAKTARENRARAKKKKR